MNANLLPQTPAIKDWLLNASQQLSDANISSPNLDAEIILANSLQQSRTYLHAHPEQIICSTNYKIANKYLRLRLNHTPIAYIFGNKEFYGREFLVTSDTLIPRPESEDIINVLKKFLLSPTYYLLPTKLVDIGTGCGCLGITAKLEFPSLDITLLDISADALKVASKNAVKLSADVSIICSNLLQKYHSNADIIIANLPYVDKNWVRSPETDFEPKLALFADDQGMSVIKKLIIQSKVILKSDGCIIIEADPCQHDSLEQFAKQHSFKIDSKLGYTMAFKRQC